jgi:hypothetical protein
MILAVIAVAGTLAGVWLGYWLQQASESRRRIADACELVIAASLEASAQFEAIEVSITTLQPTPDFASQLSHGLFSARARVGLSSPSVAAAEKQLRLAMLRAVAGNSSMNPEDRKRAREAWGKAIDAFQMSVRPELARHWFSRRRTLPPAVDPVEAQNAYDAAVAATFALAREMRKREAEQAARNTQE